ncbi:phage tail protein [Cupriavidus basilensis]|uniref:phage tail protein n=1 Tax=Cupriavidus basilensis TaxID=68895 RepID=UPI0039F701D3
MSNLQKVNLGTPPLATDGDTVRSANAKMNANVDVLNAQAALTSAPSITASQALTAAHVGKRVTINLAAPGVITLPPAAVCGADSVILLRNIGKAVATLAITAGSDDTLALSKIGLGETAMLDSNGAHTWNVLMRGRTTANDDSVPGNFAVGGSLNVAGPITTAGPIETTGTLAAGGKVSGVNNPNLVLNGSGEFGAIGWTLASFSPAVDAIGGTGSFFANAAALTAFSGDQTAQNIPVGPAVALAKSIDVANAATAGSVALLIDAFNSANVFLGNVANVTVPNGTALTRYSLSGVTPANTAYVRVIVRCGNVSAASLGIVFRRVKLEQGAISSLYSQEAGVASSVLLVGAQTVAGLKNFTTRPQFNGVDLVAKSDYDEVGKVSWFARSSAPAGFLKANGAAVPVASYAVLAASIYCGDALNATALFGYRCANSDGTGRSTTGAYIVLPDLRGEFPRGWDDGRGVDPGRSLYSWQDMQLRDHNHLTPFAMDGGGLYTIYGSAAGITPLYNTATISGTYRSASVGAVNGGLIGTALTGGVYGFTGSGSEIRPRNVALLACIRFAS